MSGEQKSISHRNQKLMENVSVSIWFTLHIPQALCLCLVIKAIKYNTICLSEKE